MATEIYWTEESEDESGLLPGHVTRVIKVGRALRIVFAGQDREFGDQYEGVLRLQMRLGTQKIKGTQAYKQQTGGWEQVPFSVTGQFEDRRFTAFSGTWSERGKYCRLDLVGLPPYAEPTAKTKRAVK